MPASYYLLPMRLTKVIYMSNVGRGQRWGHKKLNTFFEEQFDNSYRAIKRTLCRPDSETQALLVAGGGWGVPSGGGHWASSFKLQIHTLSDLDTFRNFSDRYTYAGGNDQGTNLFTAELYIIAIGEKRATCPPEGHQVCNVHKGPCQPYKWNSRHL